MECARNISSIPEPHPPAEMHAALSQSHTGQIVVSGHVRAICQITQSKCVQRMLARSIVRCLLTETAEILNMQPCAGACHVDLDRHAGSPLWRVKRVNTRIFWCGSLQPAVQTALRIVLRIDAVSRAERESPHCARHCAGWRCCSSRQRPQAPRNRLRGRQATPQGLNTASVAGQHSLTLTRDPRDCEPSCSASSWAGSDLQGQRNRYRRRPERAPRPGRRRPTARTPLAPAARRAPPSRSPRAAASAPGAGPRPRPPAALLRPRRRRLPAGSQCSHGLPMLLY